MHQLLLSFQNLADELDKWVVKYQNETDEALKTVARDQIKGIKKTLQEFVNTDLTVEATTISTDFKFDTNKLKKEASSSAKDTADAWK